MNEEKSTVIEAIEERVRSLLSGEKASALPLYPVRSTALADDLAAAPEAARRWAEAIDFKGSLGAFALAPGDGGSAEVAAGLFGCGDKKPEARVGALPYAAPERDYRIESDAIDHAKVALAWALGGYRFERYAKQARHPARLSTETADLERIVAVASGVWLARDLVNTPASDMGPANLEDAVRAVAEAHDAFFESIVGDDLLEKRYPMIHAVGRAGPQAPRLLDLRWGAEDAPKVTLVGKGVCFDTGGLDIKGARFMRHMKKDMGGAATALGLAHMIMARKLPVRLRLLIPAVENSVSSEAFRPGDVLQSRAGLTVEIGDTDAEGRLILADALTTADDEKPELLLDFATLTGAARVAVGPDIAPFYTGSEALAAEISDASVRTDDPTWRMPLWNGYDADLSSKIADLCNISSGGYAGSITAALFLRRFVEQAKAWAHFDIFAWNPKTQPGRPEGGEMQGGRAVFDMLERRYGAGA